MAYTDKAGKIIIAKWGNTQMAIFSTVVKGDLLAYDSGNYGLKLADQSDGYAGQWVACQDGVSGDTIEVAKAVIFKTPATETTGVFTDNYMCAAADVGKPFYLGESGKLQITQGATTGQVVGMIVSRTSGYISAENFLIGTTMSLSGNATVGGNLAVTGTSALTGATVITGTLEVTGAQTLTGATAINGGAVVASGKNLTMTKGYIIETPITAADDATMASGVYVIDTSAKDVNMTLPAAAAGLKVKVICTSATKQLTVTANTGDKLINASGAAKDSAKGNAAAYNNITLYAIDATSWVTLGFQGTWTYS